MVRFEELTKLVSDEEIEAAWGNANFGEGADKREILRDTLLKIAGDFSTGATATRICQALGLLGHAKCGISLTKKGRRYMFYSFYGQELSQGAQVIELLRKHGAVFPDTASYEAFCKEFQDATHND